MTARPVDEALRRELDDLVAGMCKAVNDPKRLLVLYALRDGAHTVGELCQILGAPQSNTSQHLAVLRDRGLVEAVRRGTTIVYSLRHRKVIEAIDVLRGVMSDEVDRRQERAYVRAATTGGAVPDGAVGSE